MIWERYGALCDARELEQTYKGVSLILGGLIVILLDRQIDGKLWQY